MKVLVQRVAHASVEVNGDIKGSIGPGLLLLTGFGQGDDATVCSPMASKIANLRIFPDEEGKFHRSLLDIEGAVLVVPQFTLFADTSKGRRPEFFGALKPELASGLVQIFADSLETAGIKQVAQGVFGAHMKVSLLNDGPVTIMIDSDS